MFKDGEGAWNLRARELLGDAILELVITKGVDVANVTHLRRSASSAQQVALWWSARACPRIDCTRTERLQNDHREEWRKVHETCLDNLDDPRHPRNRPPPATT